jgi:hypothetical protein
MNIYIGAWRYPEGYETRKKAVMKLLLTKWVYALKRLKRKSDLMLSEGGLLNDIQKGTDSCAELLLTFKGFKGAKK